MMDWKARAMRLKTDIPAVFLAVGKRETPLLAKVLAGVAVVYTLSPIDLIPDVIPVLGMVDDLLLLPLLVAWTVRLIPDAVMACCRQEAVGLWRDGKPKRWYYGVPIAALWLLLLCLLIRWLFF